MKRALLAVLATAILITLSEPTSFSSSQAQTTPKAPVHAKQVSRLLIRNAMIIPGPGTPAHGPTDILVDGGVIARIGTSNAQWPEADEVIDATGKYVMPGIV